MTKRIFRFAGLALALVLGLGASEAVAACAATISGKDGTGASITTCNTTDGSTGLVPSVGVLGGTNNANKLSIDANSAALVDPGSAALWGVGATGSSVPANAVLGGVSVGGNTTALIGDPCQTVARVYTPINIATATTTRLVAPTSAKKTYICGLFLFSAGTQNVGVVEGTGGTCGTGTAGVIGGTTAATGPNLTAQTGFVLPTTGHAQAATAGTNVDFCLITSAAVQVSGVLVSVQQ
jgi:hypothetical protein